MFSRMLLLMLVGCTLMHTTLSQPSPHPPPPPPRCRWTNGPMGTGNSVAVKYPLGNAISPAACMMVCEMELAYNQSCLGITFDNTMPAPANPCSIIEKTGGKATTNNKMMMMHKCDSSPPPRCRWTAGPKGTGNSVATKYQLGKAISLDACMMVCQMELAYNQSCLGITYDHTMPVPANPCSIIEITGGTPTSNNAMMMEYTCDSSPPPPPPSCTWSPGTNGTGDSSAVKYPLGKAISPAACMMVCEMLLANNQSCLGITYDNTMPAPAKPCWVIEKTGGKPTTNNKMMILYLYTCDPATSG